MWKLVHNWESLCGEPPPSPPLAITDTEHLRTVLWERSFGTPYYFDLLSPSGEKLSVWLGGPLAGMARLWKTAKGRSYRSSCPATVTAPAGVLFADGGQGVLLWPDSLSPVAEIIEAVVYFFKHGELSPHLNWIGWND